MADGNRRTYKAQHTCKPYDSTPFFGKSTAQNARNETLNRRRGRTRDCRHDNDNDNDNDGRNGTATYTVFPDDSNGSGTYAILPPPPTETTADTFAFSPAAGSSSFPSAALDEGCESIASTRSNCSANSDRAVVVENQARIDRRRLREDQWGHRQEGIMPRERSDKGKSSSFAASAYVSAVFDVGSRIAKGGRARTLRNDQDGGGCDSNDVTMTDAEVGHANYLPLSQAAVFILTNTSEQDRISDKRTQRIMNEREDMGAIVNSLGGRWEPSLETSDGGQPVITHAIWVDGDDPAVPSLSPLSVTDFAMSKLIQLADMGAAVVTKSWLDEASRLRPGRHWCELDVTDHVPEVIAALRRTTAESSPPQTVGGARVSSAGGSKGRSDASRSTYDSTDGVVGDNRGGDASSSSVGGGRTGTGTGYSSKSSESNRRDNASQLGASISATYSSLRHENPDLEHEIMLNRAMELSMLDFAIVHRQKSRRVGFGIGGGNFSTQQKSPHEILGVPERDGPYPPDELRVAYRKRALETHPDKGGQPGEFEAVARAYHQLLNGPSKSEDNDYGGVRWSAGRLGALKGTAHWDSELKDHRNLVNELYQNHGGDVNANMARQNAALEKLGLRVRDAGTKNINEKNEEIQNSCFYLSLAAGYLGGIGALTVFGMEEDEEGYSDGSTLGGIVEVTMEDSEKALLRKADDGLIMQTALMLKRAIEAAVVSAHPEWAARGMVGEEVQAFSDFLVYVLESAQTVVSEWAVVVFDACSGFVDVYKGKFYDDYDKKDDDDGGQGGNGDADEGQRQRKPEDEASVAAYTITLRYVPGHYQPLVAATTSDSTRPTLKKIISVLDEEGVLYVVTDGAA